MGKRRKEAIGKAEKEQEKHVPRVVRKRLLILERRTREEIHLEIFGSGDNSERASLLECDGKNGLVVAGDFTDRGLRVRARKEGGRTRERRESKGIRTPESMKASPKRSRPSPPTTIRWESGDQAPS